MKQHPDLTLIEQNHLAGQLFNWIVSGDRSTFQSLPKQCMLDYCYNTPTIAIINNQHLGFPLYICDRCAKLAEEIRREHQPEFFPIIVHIAQTGKL